MTKLTVELVPKSCFFSNVRDHVSSAAWDTLRRDTYQKANYLCEVCGGKGKNHPVECHEVWHYDDEKLVQTLTRLVALCPACHEVKHLGYATIKGRRQEAEQHLTRVNGWSTQRTRQYVRQCFELWNRRSKLEWKLDLTWLENNYGLIVKPKR